jgi:hypothetical protein
VVAAVLHSPSHISLESALAFHGLIPEAVWQVSSITPLRSRSFVTALGSFWFHRVPACQPRAGVTAVRLSPDEWAFIASPVRAIADLVYLRKEIGWDRDGRAFLTESMRIDEEDLYKMPVDDLVEVHDSIRSRRTR